MKRIKILGLAGSLFSFMLISTQSQAYGQHAERPTLNRNTCDPRPDILPHHWPDLPEYRRIYNRPRYWSGWVAYKIAPTSQEAMVWCENVHAGTYETKNAPPRYKRYFGPKPWEVLQTGSRPDYPKPQKLRALPIAPQASQEEDIPPVPAEIESDPNAASPSDAPAALKPAERVPAPIENR